MFVEGLYFTHQSRRHTSDHWKWNVGDVKNRRVLKSPDPKIFLVIDSNQVFVAQ